MATKLPTQTTVKAKLTVTATTDYETVSADTVTVHLYDVKTTGDYEWTVTRVTGKTETEASQNAINEHKRRFGLAPASVDSIVLVK